MAITGRFGQPRRSDGEGGADERSTGRPRRADDTEFEGVERLYTGLYEGACHSRDLIYFRSMVLLINSKTFHKFCDQLNNHFFLFRLLSFDLHNFYFSFEVN